MSVTDYNPIQSVGGMTVPCPSKYDWKLSDVSAADAGRTEDGLMHKMTIGRKVHIELEWKGVADSAVSTILQAFASEYFSVTYWDCEQQVYATKTFYVGDRSVTTHSRALNLSTVSFNIIER